MKQRIISIVCICLAILYASGLLAAAYTVPETTIEDSVISGLSMDYENRLFDESIVHTIHIEIDETAWDDLKARALYKECHDATVSVDGESYYHVGVRTKGNVTLVQSIVRDWDRYSLVVDFTAFDASQRYYGLDKFALNNCICDSSFMRDYLCYGMMRDQGIPTPLCSFAAVYLNGEYLGLYSAVECMDQSFCVRNFGYDYGRLYKPEQMDIAGMFVGTEQDCRIDLSVLSAEDGTVDALSFLGVTDTTVALQYQGEDYAAYADIWDNALFPIGRSDKRRMVDAIQRINEGKDLENTLFVDELLRYLAISSFVLNDDCYFSYAGHNYGLYEKNGRLMLIPWDYDHSLGCMGAASGEGAWTDLINLPIDEPLIGTTLAERPLVRALLSDEEYRARYHAYLDEFLRLYVESDALKHRAEKVRERILPYVLADQISGVDETRFQAAYQSNLEFAVLRARSIRGQLTGAIPATSAGQKAAPETLVDCSSFQSPDSGSLTELLLPEGSGLGFEDLIGRLVPQVNILATIATMPTENLLSLASGNSSGGMMEKLAASGKIHDMSAMQSSINQLILAAVHDLAGLILAPIALVAALIFAHRTGEKRRPKARRKRRDTHVV